MGSATEFIADLTEYEGRGASRIEPGTYQLMVEDATLTTAKTGTRGVLVTFSVAGMNARIYERFWYANGDGSMSKAVFRLVQFMDALGMPTPSKRLRLDTKMFLGKTVTAEVRDGELYNDRISSEVASFIAGQSGQVVASADVDRVDPEEDLDALEAAATAAAAQPVQAAPAAAPVSEQVVIPAQAAANSQGEPVAVDLDTLDLR